MPSWTTGHALVSIFFALQTHNNRQTHSSDYKILHQNNSYYVHVHYISMTLKNNKTNKTLQKALKQHIRNTILKSYNNAHETSAKSVKLYSHISLQIKCYTTMLWNFSQKVKATFMYFPSKKFNTCKNAFENPFQKCKTIFVYLPSPKC